MVYIVRLGGATRGFVMISRAVILLVAVVFGVVGCASTTSTANERVTQGMSTSSVTSLLGNPDNREFRESFEAWQYSDIVGFGQCEYITIYFAEGVVRTMTSVRGGSIAGCGLGSDPVNWAEIDELNQAAATRNEVEPNTQDNDDVYSKLLKLYELRERGILTQEEFEAEKKKILGSE